MIDVDETPHPRLSDRDFWKEKNNIARKLDFISIIERWLPLQP